MNCPHNVTIPNTSKQSSSMKQPTVSTTTKKTMAGKTMSERVQALRAVRRACERARKEYNDLNEYYKELCRRGDPGRDSHYRHMECVLGVVKKKQIEMWKRRTEKERMHQEAVQNCIKRGVKDAQEGLFLVHALYYLKKRACLDIDINSLQPVPLLQGGEYKLQADWPSWRPFYVDEIPVENVERGLELLKNCEAIEWDRIPLPFDREYNPLPLRLPSR